RAKKGVPIDRCARHTCKSARPRALPDTGLRAYSRRYAYKRYCFDPVVLFFGFGEQFRFCGLASFSQAARLAYLQFNEPPGDALIQKAPVPVACGACMLLPLAPGFPIVPCACAKEMPAINAAT